MVLKSERTTALLVALEASLAMCDDLVKSFEEASLAMSDDLVKSFVMSYYLVERQEEEN